MSMRATLAKFALSTLGQDVFGNILAASGMMHPPRLGTRQLLSAYNTMPWLRACVQKTSWSVATNRWQLFVAQNGSKAIRDDILSKSHNTRQRHALIRAGVQRKEIREVTSNAFLDFLATGTPPFFNGLVAGQLTAEHQDLVGESLWVLERNAIGGRGRRGTPVMYWVIPPSWVQAVPTLGNPFFHVVGPYGSRYVPAEDAVWWYQPDPSDPYARGSGTGHVLGDELETDEYASKYTKSFFYNDARPPFIVSIDGADKTEVDRVDTWWRTKHQGFGRWWKPGFIGRKIDVHEFGNNMQEMQMVPLRKYERDTILQVYGCPPEIFGITESSNRATADAAKAIYGEHVVEPRLEFKRAGLQQLAEVEFDERLIVEFVSPVPEDKVHQLATMTAIPYAFEIDEIRAAGGVPPKEDGSGKVHMVPFTVVPRKRIDEEDEPARPIVEESSTARKYNRELPDSRGQANPRAIPIGSTRKAFTDADIPKLLTSLNTQQIAKRAKPIVQDALKFFGQQAIDGVDGGISFNMRNRKVENFLSTWAGDRIKEKVNETTSDALRTTLREGAANGESFSKLTERVQSVFDLRSESDAETIARTEMGRASNFASLNGMEQAGIEEKEWLSTQDGATRDTHIDMDGQRVAIDEDFVSPSGATAQAPGDFGIAEEDINCRCAVISVIAKDGRVNRWKAIEADRKPFDRRMKRALRQGFADQEAAVLDALREFADEAAA